MHTRSRRRHLIKEAETSQRCGISVLLGFLRNSLPCDGVRISTVMRVYKLLYLLIDHEIAFSKLWTAERYLSFG